MMNRGASRFAIVLLAALCAVASWTRPTAAEEMDPGLALSVGRDYQLDHRGWNGLSELASLAHSLGCPIQPRAALDWEALEGEDVLLLLYPETPVDGAHLVSFLSAGGRVVLADDFGRGDAALRLLGIERRAGPLPLSTPVYRSGGAGRSASTPAALAVATSTLRTPLSRATPELVTNHPAYFQLASPGLDLSAPRFSFAFADSFGAVVERTVGVGRMVAISDPSVFINNMLEIHGNRLFAAHLISELCRSGRDRLLLLHGPFLQRGAPRAVLRGAPAARSAIDQAQAVNQGLLGANLHIQETLAGARGALGLRAVALTGLLLGAAVVLLLLRLMPLSSAAHDADFARVAPGPGSASSVLAVVQRYGVDRGPGAGGYLLPAVMVREEVLLRLQPYLRELLGAGYGSALRIPPAEVGRALRPVSPGAGARAERLWRELQRLPGRAVGDLAGAGRLRAWVSRRRLHRLHRLAVALFAELPMNR